MLFWPLLCWSIYLLPGTKNYLYDSSLPRESDTHGGEDVGIYARGPMCHLLSGVHEQNHIAQAMMYTTCLGPGATFCTDPPLGAAAAPSLLTSTSITTVLISMALALPLTLHN